MLDWPSFDGADQKRLICVGDTAVATRPVGASGTLAAFASEWIDARMRTEDSSNNISRFTLGIFSENRLINTWNKLLVN